MDNVKQKSKQLVIESSSDLSRITESAIYLRDNFEVDIPEATKTAGNLIKNFGMTADEAFDYIAKGFQDGLNVSDDFMDTLYEYSSYFADLGLSAQDMYNILKSGSEAGIFTVDKMADAVKEFGIRAIDGSENTKKAFTEIGLNADSVAQSFAKGGKEGQKAYFQVLEGLNSIKDPIKQNEMGVYLFGTMWEDLGEKAVLGMSSAEGAANDFSGTMDKIKKNASDNDIGNQFTQIGRTVEQDLIVPLGEALLPTIKKLVEYGKEYLPKIGEALQNINPTIIIAVAAFGLLSGVVIKILSIAGMMMPAIDAIVAVIGGMTAPMWITIGAIVALIAICIIFKDEIIGAFTAIWNTVSPIITKIWGFLKEKWDQYVAPVINEQLPKLKAQFVEAFTNIQSNLQTIIPLISGTIEKLKPIFEIIGIVIKGVVSTVIVVFGQILAFLVDTIGNIATLFNGLVTTVIGIFNIFAGIFTGDWSRVWEGIKEVISGVGTAIKAIIQQSLNFILTIVTTILNSISSIFGVSFGNVRQIVMDAWNNFVQYFIDGKNRAIGVVSEFGEKIKTAISELGGKLYNSGKNLIGQLVEGIMDGVEKVKKACKSVASTIASYFPHSPTKEGPLRDFPEVGANLMDQLITGIEDEKLNVAASVTSVTDNVSNAVVPTNTANMNSNNITIPIYLDGRKITEVVAPLLTKSIRMQGG
jgi:TP901 family phage tail tape measure protein